MQIERIAVGGWFQRTSLHLSEVYDFLSAAASPLEELKPAKLAELRAALELRSVAMHPVTSSISMRWRE